jgi:hypothetical protein
MTLFKANFYTTMTTTGTHDVYGTTTTTAVLIPLLSTSEK